VVYRKTLYARYKAGRKETLQSVARRFGVTAAELAELNKLGRKQTVAGRSLVVPARQSVDFAQEGRRTTAQQEVRYYTVRKGDTLPAIAKRFKVPAVLLAAWNNLKGKNAVALLPGKRLVVAGGASLSKNSEG